MKLNVTTDGTPCTPEEFRQELSRFNTVRLLRSIGVLADGLYFKQTKDLLTADSLAYIARAAIEAGSDDRELVATEQDIQRIASMYHNIREVHVEDEYEAFRILLRMGYAQFAHQPNPGHLIARSWYLYLDLWKRVSQAQAFPIEEMILKLIGAPYHKALGLGVAYWGSSRKGYTIPYSEEGQDELPLKYRSSPDEALSLFAWMSCTYSDIRRQNSDRASKYGLSPFMLTPLVRPEKVPRGASSQIHIVPFPSFVLEKLTSGVFHGLADAHNTGGVANEFRRIFGHVFEAYVGELLRAGSGSANVLEEFEYGSKGNRRKSPDWMVLDGDTLLVIEVKASALSLTTKMSGSISQAKNDLGGNLGKAVKQLRQFREDVLAGRTGSEALSRVKRFQLLAITQDNIPWANFVFRHLVEGGDEVQFASIEDLELLQTYCWNQSPFRILQDKTRGTHSAQQDLGRYVADYHGPGIPRHPMLSRICDDFLRDFGATVPER